MAGKDIIRMSVQELRRLPVIENVLKKHLKQKEAAELLGLSERQIRRISHRVRKEGERGLIHRKPAVEQEVSGYDERGGTPALPVGVP